MHIRGYWFQHAIPDNINSDTIDQMMIANRTPIRTTLCDLQVLWGSPGIIGVLLRFLDLSSITSLPALAQRFAADHSRVLFMLARATPTLERRLMEVLSDNGYDAVRFRQRWEGPLRANWMRDDAEQDGHGRVPPVDIRKRRSGSGPCFLSITHGGLVWPVTGSRNCVTRFKVLFRYGDLDAGAPSFELASRADPQSWNKRGPPPFLCRLFVECDEKAKSRRGGRYGALMYQSGRSTHVLQADARQLEWFHFEAAFNWQTHMLDLSANGSFWRLPFSAYPLSSVYIRNVRGAGTSSAASDFGDIEVDYCRMSDQWDKFNELGEVLPYSWYSARMLYPYDPAPRDAMRPTL